MDTKLASNGEVVILCTSDVHCGVDQGFGYAGLYQVKENLKKQGYKVILVDGGDEIRGIEDYLSNASNTLTRVSRSPAK